MRKIALLLMVLAVATAGVFGARRPVRRRPARPQNPIVAGNNRFALELYRQVCGKPGNLFFSPSSIHTALAMTYAGAQGTTAGQMARTLYYDPGKEFFTRYGKLIDLTRPGKGAKYQFHIANALWLQHDKPFLPPFLACNTEHFKAGLFDVDFRRQSEPARLRINRWVAEKTAQKIKDLLPAGSVNALTRMVLTNAIYFKGDWASQFRKAATRKLDFHVTPDRKVQAAMMYQSGRFGYTETPDLQALRMPYQGDDLSMVVLLPRRAGGLANVEKSLTAQSLAGLVGRLRFPRKVQVFFPRFEMEYKMQMKPILSRMGMSEAFQPQKADFSGMTGSRDLHISDVYHKAFVKVDEKSTEAAAATGVVVGVTSVGPTRPLVFRADHPFCFLIRHEKTGLILFLGRVAEPRE